MEEKTYKERWTYLGIELWGGKRDKKTWLFEFPEGSGGFQKPMLPSYAKAGSIWEVTMRENGNVFYRGNHAPQYVGMIEDTERCALLQVKSQAAEVELRMLKQAKADMSNLEIDKCLEPLRWEYAKRNRVGKAALLATIYDRIGMI